MKSANDYDRWKYAEEDAHGYLRSDKFPIIIPSTEEYEEDGYKYVRERYDVYVFDYEPKVVALVMANGEVVELES